jgi:hypothetical protein
MTEIIYKEEDCEWLEDGIGYYEYWLHKPSGKTIKVPTNVVHLWEDAEPQEGEYK